MKLCEQAADCLISHMQRALPGINIIAHVRLSIRALRDQADPSHNVDVTRLLLITGSLPGPPTCTASYAVQICLLHCFPALSLGDSFGSYTTTYRRGTLSRTWVGREVISLRVKTAYWGHVVNFQAISSFAVNGGE
jgi:hypothetical protein